MVGEKTSLGTGIMLPNIPQELSLKRLYVNSSGSYIKVGRNSQDSTSVNSLIVYNNDSDISASTGMVIEQGGTGDPALHFLLTGGNRITMGMDNSDSDVFSISYTGGVLGTSTGFAMSPGTGKSAFGDVAISDTTPTGILSCVSTTLGFIPPRMTSAQMEAISSPTDGTIVFNSTSGSLYLRATTWKAITAS